MTIRISRRRRAFPTAAEVSAVAVAADPCMPDIIESEKSGD